MHEFELIKKYFSKLSKLNKSALNLNDDVFFDKKKNLIISIDTYFEKTHFIDFKKHLGQFWFAFFCTSSDLLFALVKKKL